MQYICVSMLQQSWILNPFCISRISFMILIKTNTNFSLYHILCSCFTCKWINSCLIKSSCCMIIQYCSSSLTSASIIVGCCFLLLIHFHRWLVLCSYLKVNDVSVQLLLYRRVHAGSIVVVAYVVGQFSNYFVSISVFLCSIIHNMFQ